MRSVMGVAALAALVLVVSGRLGAAVSEVGEAAAQGEILYRVHCASCHGSEARGDGPVSGELRKRPSDLTWLRDEEGGFAAEQARRYIDGREELGGHGPREMPIWGLTFQQRSRPGEHEDEVAGRIDDLVEFLRSIQRSNED